MINPGNEARARLNRDKVVGSAIALADASGIESLSMRKLGGELGVEAMSLYNHVSNKGDLTDAMIDGVFAEIDLPSGGTDWRTAMRHRAMGAVRRHERQRHLDAHAEAPEALAGQAPEHRIDAAQGPHDRTHQRHERRCVLPFEMADLIVDAAHIGDEIVDHLELGLQSFDAQEPIVHVGLAAVEQRVGRGHRLAIVRLLRLPAYRA